MEELFSNLLNLLKSNDIFSGVAFGSMATTALAGIVYSLRNAPLKVLTVLKKLLTIKLEIYSDQSEYKNVENWLCQFNNQRLRSYLLNSKRDSEDDEVNDGDCYNAPRLNPGSGTHLVWYKKQPLLIAKNIQVQNTNGVVENVCITVLGFKSKLVEIILKEISNISQKTHLLKVFNITREYNGYWEITYKNKRTPNTLIFDKKYEIINSINTFYNKKQWYIERGIPFKKGILLSGPPGTGKSSLVSVIASELNLPIYYLNLSNSISSSNLIKFTSEIRYKSIALIEDIDCLFIAKSRDKETENNDKSENLSILLNILDGINSNNGTIYILTTNYIDKIDKALIRPGRIDIHIEMNNFNWEQIKEMYTLFYTNLSTFDLFYSKIKNHINIDKMSPAMFQGLFMVFEDPNKLIWELENNIEEIKSQFIR